MIEISLPLPELSNSFYCFGCLRNPLDPYMDCPLFSNLAGNPVVFIGNICLNGQTWIFHSCASLPKGNSGSHHFSSTASHVVDSNGKTSSRLSLAAIATETITESVTKETINIHQHPSTITSGQSGHTLWLFNIAMENGPFIDDFPINTFIYKGFSMAMLNNQRVLVASISQISTFFAFHYLKESCFFFFLRRQNRLPV